LNHARSGLPYQTYRDFGKPALDRSFAKPRSRCVQSQSF